jgi:cytidylate kinase
VATGKSVVGRLVARRLGYRFLDTGAMYRALTWLALQRRIDVHDHTSLAALARHHPISIDDEGQVVIDGRQVPLQEARTEIDRHVSLVAQVPAVRDALVAQQRDIASAGRIVMAGRDIGTVVAPDAPVKVYLQASTRERARRRWLELQKQGVEIDQDIVLEQLIRRDKLDSERAHSPLHPAADAHIIDTDKLSIEQVVDTILQLATEDR